MDDLQVVLNHAMRLVVKKRIIDKVKIKDLCEQMGILSVNRRTVTNYSMCQIQSDVSCQSFSNQAPASQQEHRLEVTLSQTR